VNRGKRKTRERKKIVADKERLLSYWNRQRGAALSLRGKPRKKRSPGVSKKGGEGFAPGSRKHSFPRMPSRNRVRGDFGRSKGAIPDSTMKEVLTKKARLASRDPQYRRKPIRLKKGRGTCVETPVQKVHEDSYGESCQEKTWAIKAKKKE